MNSINKLQGPYIKSVITGIVTFIAVVVVTSSLVIALIFAVIASSIQIIRLKRVDNKKYEALSSAWPEVIDHIITGIQSGLSINESLAGLAKRGPLALHEHFSAFAKSMKENGDFDTALAKLKNECGHPGGDQIFEAIAISKTLGGAELLNVLRSVALFLRQDLALRREIEVKHGWIKNSAHLSAAAPWLLLLLLSTQPATASAFSNRTGASILIFGALMTAIAYIWMNRLARLPEMPRVFGEA